MKIIITGAGGFVGKELARVFAADHQVIALTHAALDITNREAVTATFTNSPAEDALYNEVSALDRKSVV